jgi:hypothetical protein
MPPPMTSPFRQRQPKVPHTHFAAGATAALAPRQRASPLDSFIRRAGLDATRPFRRAERNVL